MVDRNPNSYPHSIMPIRIPNTNSDLFYDIWECPERIPNILGFYVSHLAKILKYCIVLSN